jgi:hypothetical protein
MTLQEKIEQLQTLLAKREEIDRQIDEMLGGTVPTVSAKKVRKVRQATQAGSGLQSEVSVHHAKRQHPETPRIEELLMAGEGVPSILEKVDVSPPTVYLIKTRLKQEGGLPF